MNSLKPPRLTKAKQLDFWPMAEPGPEEIIAEAMAWNPIAIYALYSGGDDSLAATDWAMENVPDCQVLHIHTGIGLEITRQHVHDTCAARGWPLTEIRAKEDCGQDYDKIVERYGFPGPSQHIKMYIQLKQRAIELLVRREKAKVNDPSVKRRARVMLLTGIRHDESARRMGYGGREINHVGAQMWVNHLYWKSQEWFHQRIRERGLPRGPASQLLGMSGECLCGAFADEGELAMVRLIEPPTADRIVRLQDRARACGHNWGWEEGPPTIQPEDLTRQDLFMPMCMNCEKGAPRNREAA